MEKATKDTPFSLRADDWNTIIEGVSTFIGRDKNGKLVSPDQLGNLLKQNLQCEISYGGGNLAERSILTFPSATTAPGIDPAVNPFEVLRTPCFAAVAPGATTDPVLITIEPYNGSAGGLIRAVYRGIAVCTVTINDTSHKYATAIASDSTKLTSASSGPVRILYRAGSSGDQVCIVDILGVAPASASTGFFAVLDSSTTVGFGSQMWKWQQVGWDNGTLSWVAIGSVSASYNAAPLQIDGINLCNPVAGLRVWMIPSTQTPGYYEFLPTGYADLNSGTYYPGMWSVDDGQTFKGNKQHDGDWSVRDSITSNSGATYKTIRYKQRTSGSAPPVPPSATAFADEFGSYTQFKQTTVGSHQYLTTTYLGFHLIPTAADRLFSVAGPVTAVDHIDIWNSSNLDPTTSTYSPITIYCMRDATAGPSSNPANWTNIAASVPSSGTFPNVYGISILSGDVAGGGYGWISVGLNEQLVVYDSTGGALSGTRYGGGSSGGYWRGFKWQGGDAALFRLANGVVIGWSTTSIAAGELIYFNGTDWVILAPPASDHIAHTLQCTDGVISWN